MSMEMVEQVRRFGARMQWQRGLRAGFAVLTAMAVCHWLKLPMGWAALGGFEAVLVDSGGPYRTRLTTMATVLLGGAVSGFLGAMAPGTSSVKALLATMVLTAAVCFAVTFARVVAQPIAATSVILLVIYFVGLGGTEHTMPGVLRNVGLYCVGGAWAAALSLVLWTVDPFRPARLAVAASYRTLGEFTGWVSAESEDDEARARQGHEWQRRVRVKMEAARLALAETPARAPARTVTARSLTVMLETADMLYSRTIRLTEMLEVAHDDAARAAVRELAEWLGHAEKVLELELAEKPMDQARSVGRGGSHWMELVERRRTALEMATGMARAGTVLALVGNEGRQALQEVEIALETIYTLWTGLDARRMRGDELPMGTYAQKVPGWLEAVQANWNGRSVMLRHALRMGVVGAVDIGLLHFLPINHGFWLAMTSIIVLQPYGSKTVRVGAQRVGGTIAGGVVAAVLVVAVRDPWAMMVTIAGFAVLTLATYAVDYGWYSFFLTPTFVLLSLPHARDWQFAGVRMGTTVLGASVAVVAMRLLWPTRAGTELGRRLGRCAAADAAYVRAVLRYWSVAEDGRVAAEREMLAPARRACGLASNDAEEAVDRVMQEHGFSGRRGLAEDEGKELALSFTTYVRRLTQSVTTLAAVGQVRAGVLERLTGMAERLDRLGVALEGGGEVAAADGAGVGLALMDVAGSVFGEQMQRMERQVEVLERAGRGLGAGFRGAA